MSNLSTSFASSIDSFLQETAIASVEFREETESTNTLALDLSANSEVLLPLLVLCDRQTSGRGRGANTWWSADGALTFSLVISPTSFCLVPSQQSLIPLATGFAIAKVLGEVVENNVKIKWPNDVMIENRKCCGILTERGKNEDAIVIGCGINSNNSMLGAPQEVIERAVSLTDILQTRLDQTNLLKKLIDEILLQCQRISSDSAALLQDISELDFLAEKHVKMQAGTEFVAGVGAGIDESGRLLVLTDHGMRSIVAGTILEFNSSRSDS